MRYFLIPLIGLITLPITAIASNFSNSCHPEKVDLSNKKLANKSNKDFDECSTESAVKHNYLEHVALFRIQEKEGSDQTFRYGQKKYYICETAGPGRFLFGQKSLTRKNYSLEPLIIN